MISSCFVLFWLLLAWLDFIRTFTLSLLRNSSSKMPPLTRESGHKFLLQVEFLERETFDNGKLPTQKDVVEMMMYLCHPVRAGPPKRTRNISAGLVAKKYLYGTNEYLCHQNTFPAAPSNLACCHQAKQAKRSTSQRKHRLSIRQWTVVPVRVPACVRSLSLVAARLLHLLLRGKIQMPKFYRKL